MKLKLKWIITFILLFAICAIPVSAKVQGEIKDSTLVLELQTLDTTVNQTNESNGRYASYTGQEKLMYDEVTSKGFVTDAYGYESLETRTTPTELPVYYAVRYSSSCNIPGRERSNSTFNGVTPYQQQGWIYDSDGDRYFGWSWAYHPNWYIPVGYLRDLPSGYYITNYPGQSQTVAGTLISMPGLSGNYAIGYKTFNGQLLQQQNTTVSKTGYRGVDPIYVKSTNFGSLSNIYNNFLSNRNYHQANIQQFYYNETSFTYSDRTYKCFLTATMASVRKTYDVNTPGGSTNSLSETELNSLQDTVEKGFPLYSSYVSNAPGYPTGYLSWYKQSTTTSRVVYLQPKLSHFVVANIATGSQVFANVEPYVQTYTHIAWPSVQSYDNVILNNCITSSTWNTAVPVEINGGQYSGAPALNNKQFTVNKGTITDTGNSKSTFMVGADSEITETVKDGSTTITTVKLSNPPPPALQLSAA